MHAGDRKTYTLTDNWFELMTIGGYYSYMPTAGGWTYPVKQTYGINQSYTSPHHQNNPVFIRMVCIDTQVLKIDAQFQMDV